MEVNKNESNTDVAPVIQLLHKKLLNDLINEKLLVSAYTNKDGELVLKHSKFDVIVKAKDMNETFVKLVLISTFSEELSNEIKDIINHKYQDLFISLCNKTQF